MNIGVKNIRDSSGNFGTENQVLGIEVIDSEAKLKWINGSGNDPISTSVEPFNISLSTLNDNENSLYYTYSSLILENSNYTKIKLYISSESQISTNTENKIYVRIIDSNNIEYMTGNVIVTQSDINTIININLTQTTELTVNNKYLLGIYKEVVNGDKIYLYNNPYKNPLNGFFKLTNYTSPYSNVTIYDSSDSNNIIDNTVHVKFYWYKLY